MLLSRSITYAIFLLCSLWAISCQVVSKPFQSSRIKELAAYCDTIVDTFSIQTYIQKIKTYAPFDIHTQDFYYIPCQEQQNAGISLKDSVKLCEDKFYIWLSPIARYYDVHAIYPNASKKKHRKQLIDPKSYSNFLMVKQGDLFWSDGCQWRVDSVHINRLTECEHCLNIRTGYVRFVLVDCLQEFKERGQCKCAAKGLFLF